MTRNTKFAVLAVTILLSIAIPYLLVQKSVGEIDLSPIGNSYVVDFNEMNQKIYILTKAWGLTGNNERIVVSTVPITDKRQFDKTRDYSFYTSDVYYQKKGIDTLAIYAALSSIGPYPVNFESDVKIIIHSLDDFDEIADVDNNYKKYGLSRATIYQ